MQRSVVARVTRANDLLDRDGIDDYPILNLGEIA